jgi:glycosyltransferase involved in cell wall biosynthesis
MVPSSLPLLTLGQARMYGLSRRLFYSRRFQSLFLKAARVGTGMLGLEKVIRNSGVDIVLAVQDNAAFACAPVAHRLKLPLVTDLHGSWAEELVASQIISYNSSEFSRIQGITKDVLSQSALISTHGEALRDYVLKTYGLEAEHVVAVQQGGRLHPSNPSKRLGASRVAYAGTVTHRKKVDLYVESIPAVQKVFPKAEFYMTGRGDLLPAMKKLAGTVSARINYFWFQEEAAFFEFLDGILVGVLPASNDVSSRTAAPGKLFDYWSVGVPVVAPDIGGWTELIHENRAGTTTGFTPAAFADGICELLRNPEEAIRIGAGGRAAIERTYNWQNSAKVLYEALNRLV